MDSKTICDQRMVKFMKKIADKYAIKWQPEILTGGGTDTMGLQQYTAGGSIAGAISVPTRHIHQVIETCNTDDIMHSINLLVNCIQEIDDYNWSH
jgi:endoglucanase